jgi:hypothetical protein
MLSTRKVVQSENQAVTRQQTITATDRTLDERKIDVVLPDMFRLFLSEPPRVNPKYDLVKSESEAWFSGFVFTPLLNSQFA